MTKLKSKKMTKSTFAIIIMAIIMVAMLAFGGTYAYFTATTKEDKAEITLGFVKLKDNDAFASIVLENAFPGQQILPAGSYGDTPNTDPSDNKGIILTINTNDRNGNYVAVRFDFQITLNDEDGTVLNDETVNTAGTGYRAVADGWVVTDAPTTEAEYIKYVAAQYTKIYDDLKADNIKNTTALNMNLNGEENTKPASYYWNNYKDEAKNIYFLVATYHNDEDVDDWDHTQLKAVGATSLLERGETEDSKAKWDGYEATVELIVNQTEFRLSTEISDNWSEKENGPEGEGQTSEYETYSALGLQGALIEIVMTAASVQATGDQTLAGPDTILGTDDDIEVIKTEDAEAELIKLLPGYDFENQKLKYNGYNNEVLTPVTPPVNP